MFDRTHAFHVPDIFASGYGAHMGYIPTSHLVKTYSRLLVAGVV
jgi:hypothetical protein